MISNWKKRFLLAAVICLQAAVGFSAELDLVDGNEQFIFSGRESMVEARLRNRADKDAQKSLSWRLFQASSATVAPVGERTEFDPITFPAGQAVVVRIPVNPPGTRRISSFLVRVFEGDEELGVVKLRVCPEGLLRGLEKLSGELAVFDPGGVLRDVLRQQEVSFLDWMEAQPGDFSGKLLMVRLDSPEAERAWRDLSGNVPEGCAILFIVSPGVTGAELLAPVKPRVKAGQRMVIVQEWFLPEIENSPLSQLRLLRMAKLLLNPDEIKFPLSER